MTSEKQNNTLTALNRLDAALQELRLELDKQEIDRSQAIRLLKTAQVASVEIENVIEGLRAQFPVASEPSGVGLFAGKKALVVDDEPDIVDLIVQRLKKLGFSAVEHSDNGRDAYNLCVQHLSEHIKFDLIVSDWRMPKMDGITFLQTVRKNVFLKDIPFMFVTANDDAKSIQNAIEEKVDSYLVKPFKGSDFDDKVRHLIRSRQNK